MLYAAGALRLCSWRPSRCYWRNRRGSASILSGWIVSTMTSANPLIGETKTCNVPRRHLWRTKKEPAREAF